MTEPNNEQTSESRFDGPGTRPAQTDEQIAKAADAEEYMRDVIDPELGINVVDLGLVYDIWMEEEEGQTECVINMTLTSPACPLTDVIEDQAEQAIVGNSVADKMTLNWVWMPPWGPQMITEEGREQLRALGFAV
ncbi:metal-sulfur cluster assembly factor [Corynebacterium breve]|uniref:Metal-sulfur cluster assembly factor n=1 Tax=Corynebacterium breve TaxID=3049799 RepID=A0ABY8VGT4_9CORY|nr:metal-sulfur cluster assembly factor [Corynebacterium breve]WIM68876.1 metal-sulfur cluster assembly factor [Corynebacterium breve]